MLSKSVFPQSFHSLGEDGLRCFTDKVFPYFEVPVVLYSVLVTRLSEGSQAAPDTTHKRKILFLIFAEFPPPTPPSRKNTEKRENVWQGKFAGARILSSETATALALLFPIFWVIPTNAFTRLSVVGKAAPEGFAHAYSVMF